MTTVADNLNATSNADTAAPPQKSFVAKAGEWLAFLGGIASILYAAFKIFNPIGDVDLTVRVDQEVQASLPSRAAENLQLVYNGQPITRASVVTVEIVNSGKRRIGADDQPWTVNLRSTDGSTVVALGEPRATPTSRHVSIAKGQTRDAATVSFGLFNSGDQVAVDLMLLEPKQASSLPIRAETNVPDLKEPVTGRRNVRERLRDAFTPPLLVLSAGALAAVLIRDRRKIQRMGVPLSSEHKLPKMLWLVVMGAVFTTLVLANIVGWAAAFYLAHS
jgi:hypothetical protein